MPKLSAYLPQDRLRALAQGISLPERTNGAALFADISGFTPLTEALTRQHGPRRGIEALIAQINAVYSTLITEIERCNGSVISFAGDSMTCWFEHSSPELAPTWAVSAALRMQAGMEAFPQLGLKVAVTCGAARRFVVGDPTIRRMDALAGATIARLATGEQLSRRGEVLVDTPTVEALGESLAIQEWRTAETGECFALVANFTGPLRSGPPIPIPEVDAEVLRPWILPAIFTREQAEHGLFLTELRPAVALFLRFSGIDYDNDEQAGEKLDRLIGQAQSVLARYEGILADLTIGDKGSYLYAAFGAPLVHEDDARRAMQAALDLRSVCQALTYLTPVQIGISQGVMRCGAYGGDTRRAYGVLGDEVNLAARLMSTAAPGDILLSRRVHKLVAHLFSFEPRPPLPLKGKAEPLPVFALTGQRHLRAIRLEEPHYALPMMGRQAELGLIERKLDLAQQGHGQVIGIVAEAGMGKSRLVAEAIRLARKKGFTGYGGACEASGINTPYLVWKPIWQAFFGLDLEAPLRRQLRILEGEVEERAPERTDAIPVLSVLLDIPIEETELTHHLEPKDRRNLLIALLEECLRSAAAENPLLLVLEDLHWLDALSHELLETLARASADLPVCFILAYRPPDQPRLQAERVEGLEYFTRITLDQLTPGEAEGLIRAKLAQLFPERTGLLPQALADELTRRAEGNPFYIEELLNYLRDRGINPYESTALMSLDLPTSLHALILSRIDRLSDAQQIALKSASIIGRSFRLSWLQGYYPALGTAERVKADLDLLAHLDLTPLDTPEPELAYLFKHIITLEVAYESLSFATRALLHQQLAQFVESLGGERFLDLLAFHYGRSENVGKQREYFYKAGQAAQAAYANEAALEYYERLLPLLAPEDQIVIQAQRGVVYALIGQYAQAEQAHCAALGLAEQTGASAAAARERLALGKLCRLRGEFEAAQEWLEQAQAEWQALGDSAGLGQALRELGAVCWRQGAYEQARQHLHTALECARQANDLRGQVLAQLELGTVALYQGDNATAQTVFEQAMDLARALDDKPSIAAALQTLGNVAFSQGDFVKAHALCQQSLTLRHEMGDKSGIAGALTNLGNVSYGQGSLTAAREYYEQSLALQREIGDRRGIAITLGNIGNVAYGQGDYAAAQSLYEESLALRQELGDRQGVTLALTNLGLVAYSQGHYSTAQALYEQSLAQACESGDRPIKAYALLGLGMSALAMAEPDNLKAVQAARQPMLESLAIRQEMGQQVLITSNLTCLAGAGLRLGEAQRAARLLGAVSAALQQQGAAIEPDVQTLYDQTLAGARAVLGETGFQAAWAEGQASPLDAAAAQELADKAG